MKNKFLIVNLAVSFALVCSIGLSACGETPHNHTYASAWSHDETHHWKEPTCDDTTEKKDYAEHSFGADGKCVCGYDQAQQGGPSNGSSVSLSDFVKNHKDKAVSFVSAYIAPSVFGNKDVLSREYYISANADDELNEVTVVYAYKVDETKRGIEIAKASVATPVDLDDIVGGTASITSDKFTVERTTAFEFDAKDNYERQALSNALYSAANKESESLKVFTEVESPYSYAKYYNLLSVGSNKVDIYEVGVRADSEATDETVITNLASFVMHTSNQLKTSYTVSGANILSEGYTLEEFKDGTEKPDPDPDEKDKEVTDVEVQEALTENCADGVINKALAGINIDKNNISNENWYITTDSDGNITGAEYAFNYQRTGTSVMFVIGSVSFNSPVSREDLVDGKIGNATYKTEYSLNYDSAIQDARKDLTEAILKVCGVELTEGSTRIIVDENDYIDTTMGALAHQFTAVEITDSGVKEYSIGIKRATNDAGYISYLQNESNYRITSEKSYIISGTALAQEEQTNIY